MSPRTPLQLVLLFLLTLQLSFVIAKPTIPQHGVVRRAPTGTARYDTNSKRLAAGLPPLTPRRRFTPTRVDVAARAPSPISYSGYVRISDWASGTPLGYVSKTTSDGVIEMTTSPGDRLPVTFSFDSSDTTFELGINDSLNWHYLGGQGIAHFGPSSTTVNSFVRTNSVSCGSAPQVVGHSAGLVGPTESCIWKFNASNSEFTGVWTNPDLAGMYLNRLNELRFPNAVPISVVDIYFYISDVPGNEFLFLTSNPNRSAVTRVRLYLETA